MDLCTLYCNVLSHDCKSKYGQFSHLSWHSLPALAEFQPYQGNRGAKNLHVGRCTLVIACSLEDVFSCPLHYALRTYGSISCQRLSRLVCTSPIHQDHRYSNNTVQYSIKSRLSNQWSSIYDLPFSACMCALWIFQGFAFCDMLEFRTLHH